MANNWFTGTGLPAPTLGTRDDLYLDLDVGRIYRKTAGTWVNVGLLRAVTASRGPGWQSGSGEPTSELGDEGDMYLDIRTARAFKKTAGTWLFLADLRGVQGPPGPSPGASYIGSLADRILVPNDGSDVRLGEVEVHEPGVYLINAKATFDFEGPEFAAVDIHCDLRWTGEFLDRARATLFKPGRVGSFMVGTVNIPGVHSATLALIGRGEVTSDTPRVAEVHCRRNVTGPTDQLRASSVRISAVAISP